MHGIDFDIAHMLAGFLVLLSFLMLYQVRLLPLLNVLAAHAFVLALSVAWQAHIQHAPHLYITAGIALVFKAIIVPLALRRMVFRMGIHREIETVVSIGLTMLAGMALVALSLEVMLPLTAKAEPVVREDIALALVGRADRLADDGDAAQRGQPGGRLHVVGERHQPRRHRSAGHAAGGGDQRRVLGADRASSSSASSCSAFASGSTPSMSACWTSFAGGGDEPDPDAVLGCCRPGSIRCWAFWSSRWWPPRSWRCCRAIGFRPG